MADAAATRIPWHVFVYRSEPISSVYHHARHDHGDLSPHRAVSGRFRELPHPADGRRPGHGFPLRQHPELLALPPPVRPAALDHFLPPRPPHPPLPPSP